MEYFVVLSQFCPNDGPSIVFCTERQDNEEVAESILSRDGNFVTFDGPISYYSNNDDSKICKKYAKSIDRLYTRGLSFESVGPSKEGIVVFSDNVGGVEQFCFSYIFNLRDSKSRGYTRWLSLNYFTTSFFEISINWGYLNRCFNVLIRHLKNQAISIFQKETGGSVMKEKDFLLKQKHLGKNSFVIKQIQQGITKKRDLKSSMKKDHKEKLRPLEKLLNIPNIHRMLHKNLSALVKGVAERFVYIDLTQFDHILQQTRQIRKKFHHHHVVVKEEYAISVLLIFCEAVCKLLHSNPRTKEAEKNPKKKITIESLKRYGEDVLELILYSILVGHQIILIGDDKEFLFHLCLAFQDLLPDYSRDNVVFSIEYNKTLRFLIIKKPTTARKSKVEKKENSNAYEFIVKKRVDLKKSIVLNLFSSSFKNGITNIEVITQANIFSKNPTAPISSLVRFVSEKVLYLETQKSKKNKVEKDSKVSFFASFSAGGNEEEEEEIGRIKKKDILPKSEKDAELEKKLDLTIRLRQIKRLNHKCNIIVNLLVNQSRKVRERVLEMFYVTDLDKRILMNYVYNYESNQKELEMIHKHQKNVKLKK